jgi:hypothetical protein
MWSSFWVDGINQFVLFAVIAVHCCLADSSEQQVDDDLESSPIARRFFICSG